mmetsp:Transcript_74455/g.177345  ORF Transcript_74455/g.177345 Transcript_74455/m.177345 type:complete len:143 (-) Transcript_74455:133-561(-)
MLSVGQTVEMFSATEQGYVNATVTSVHGDGSVDVEYFTAMGPRAKHGISMAEQGKVLRMTDSSMSAVHEAQDEEVLQTRTASGRLLQGQSVQIYSKTDQEHIPGTVTVVHGDGSVDVEYFTSMGPRTKHSISVEKQSELLKA